MRIKNMWVTLVLVAAILTLPLLTTACTAGTKTGNVDTFRKSLEKDGFTVQEGMFEKFDIIKMADLGLIPTCWGNNPSTPYMIYKLPMAPGQTVPNMMTEGVVDDAHKGIWNDYRLRPDEAIVFFGKTPPEVSYFSYRSYLGLRYFPDEGRSRRVFASLGDTINNMTIKTGSDKKFEQPIVIIIAADKNIAERMSQAITEAGYSEDIINQDIIPAELVNMGLDKESDNFTFIHRVAFFKDQKAGDDYLGKKQGRVFRVTPDKPVAKLKPFEVAPLRVRGTGDDSELDYIDTLNELEQAIIKKYGNLRPTKLATSMWLFEGNDAIQRGVDVIGENRDTTYLKTTEFMLVDDPNDFVIVYGVNHAVTGKATYSNFGVYGTTLLNGVGAVSDKELEGTAEEYLPDNPDAKYFYVWKVARKSLGDKRTLEVPYGIGAAGVNLDAHAFIGFRAYLEKKTKVGPYWPEILYDKAIKFSPASP